MLLERPAEVDRVDLVRKGWPGVPWGEAEDLDQPGFAPKHGVFGPYGCFQT